MTVGELIQHLKQFPPHLKVEIWTKQIINDDKEWFGGNVHSTNECDGVLFLKNDYLSQSMDES